MISEGLSTNHRLVQLFKHFLVVVLRGRPLEEASVLYRTPGSEALHGHVPSYTALATEKENGGTAASGSGLPSSSTGTVALPFKNDGKTTRRAFSAGPL